jgi:hypothetical protein
MPYRWLCGRDKNGEPINPDGLEKEHPVQYIPAIKDKVTPKNEKGDWENGEWQGALAEHPVVADSDLWSYPPLEIDLSRAAVQQKIVAYRQIAIDAAEPTEQIEAELVTVGS